MSSTSLGHVPPFWTTSHKNEHCRNILVYVGMQAEVFNSWAAWTGYHAERTQAILRHTHRWRLRLCRTACLHAWRSLVEDARHQEQVSSHFPYLFN